MRKRHWRDIKKKINRNYSIVRTPSILTSNFDGCFHVSAEKPNEFIAFEIRKWSLYLCKTHL